MKWNMYATVLETLQRIGGKALEQNLLEELRLKGYEINLSELRRVLMKLEVHDKVRVVSLDVQRKLIELVEQKA